MRKVFLDDLPRHIKGTYRGKIDWGKSVGSKISFEYGELKGKFEIVKYSKSTRILLLKYKECFHNVNANNFAKANIGELLNKYYDDFKIEIGQVFKNDKINITIIERRYKRIKNGKNEKLYRCKCNKCNSTNQWFEEIKLLNEDAKCTRCSIFNNNKIDTNWWKYYKGNGKNRNLNSFIRFCIELKNLNGELIGDFVDSTEKISNFIDEFRFYQTTEELHAMYLAIKKIKNEMKKYGDEFVRIVKGENRIIEVEFRDNKNNIMKIGISGYKCFASGRERFVNKLKENNHLLVGSYKGSSKRVLVNFQCGHQPSLVKPNNYMSSESISLCPICSKRRVIKGINDIATTHPKVIEYFVNIKDAYKYSYGSSQEVSFKCLNCGAIKKMKINQLIKYGFSCKNCSDGISYCEKFMQNVLSQLNIKNIFQLSRKHFEWVENYRYDFYIPSMNLIIEMDGGLGHGKDNNMSGQSGKESKAVDDYKDRLAREHGIEVIRIGCNYGKFLHRFKYIKDNIISKLDEVLDLSKINWEQCDKNSLSSKVIEVCELWNKYKNTGKIKEVVNLNKTVIRDYLKRGTELNLCMYDPKLEMIKNGKNSGNHLFKKIICLENNMIFNSANECREKSKDIFGVELSEIVLKRYCNKKIPYKNLHFLFLDDYKTITKEEMSIFREKKNDYLEKISKHVLCLETGDIFKSVMDCERMSKYVLNTKIGSSSISLVCSGKQKSTKGFHFKFVSDLTPEERIKYNIDDKLQESQEEIK